MGYPQRTPKPNRANHQASRLGKISFAEGFCLQEQHLGFGERQWRGVSEGPGEAVKNIVSFNDF